jgi:ribosome recycling factor
MNEVLKDVEQRMIGAVEAFQAELAKLRTGRASLALVDGITVDYYGSQTPLNQVAALSVPDPTTISIAPWEPKVLAEVEKAILRSNLGLTPNNDGKVVRLNIPALTEERRKELAKVAHEVAETARNEVRQVRRDGNQDQVQKLTDTYIEKINTILKKKEEEVMEV